MAEDNTNSSINNAIQDFKNEISNVEIEANENGNDQLREILYRMTKLYVNDKNLSIPQAVELFVVASEKATSVISKDLYTSIIGDTFWLFGVDSAKSPEKLARIGLLMKALVEKEILSDKILKQTTEGGILEHAGLIPSKKTLDEIIIRINTIDNFDQKYSFTFKDDPEGYARLLAYLSSLEHSQSTANDCTDIVLSLIGKYDLCPQKVLYRIFESYDACSASHKTSSSYRNAIFKIVAGLIPNKKAIIVETITSALYYYTSLGKQYCPTLLVEYPAKLIADDIIGLDDIWPYLLPSDDDAQIAFEKLLKTVSFILFCYLIIILFIIYYRIQVLKNHKVLFVQKSRVRLTQSLCS